MSGGMIQSPDPANQWEWHEAYRDMAKNQYRTSYTDMSHFKEINVRTDYPSGYGGHIPSIRHDILYRNTAFDRQQALRRNDPSRDSHPSFKDQIAGIPTWCAKPQGARKNPTLGVFPHDGTTTNLISPWAVVRPVRPTPSYRNVPSSLARARSVPQLGGSRVNQAAVSAGAAALGSPVATASAAQLPQMPQMDAQPTSPEAGADRLKKTVSMANKQSNQQRMITEQEMLMGEVFGQEQSTDMME
jgi:hypothetical protein